MLSSLTPPPPVFCSTLGPLCPPIPQPPFPPGQPPSVVFATPPPPQMNPSAQPRQVGPPTGRPGTQRTHGSELWPHSPQKHTAHFLHAERPNPKGAQKLFQRAPVLAAGVRPPRKRRRKATSLKMTHDCDAFFFFLFSLPL